MANGAVLYSGPSRLNGDPIVVIATGFPGGSASHNIKTGAMVQVWILRQDRYPSEAVNDGADIAICGDCPLRRIDGERRCYVRLDGPASVWKAWKRDMYPTITPTEFGVRCGSMPVRFGAYGDPAALPAGLIGKLAAGLKARWTGYTHQWKRFPSLRRYVMASCDSVSDRQRAQRLGWRTFRVGSEALPGEVLCPASIEAGKRTTCSACGLCNGSRGEADRRKAIFIPPHGRGAKFFNVLREGVMA